MEEKCEGMLWSYKKDKNLTIFSNLDGTRGYVLIKMSGEDTCQMISLIYSILKNQKGEERRIDRIKWQTLGSRVKKQSFKWGAKGEEEK